MCVGGGGGGELSCFQVVYIALQPNFCDIRLITRVSVRYGECNKCFILRGTPHELASAVQATFLHHHNRKHHAHAQVTLVTGTSWSSKLSDLVAGQ